MAAAKTPKPDETGTDVVAISEAERALIAQTKSEVDQSDLIVPHLKLVQGTTKGVPDGVHAGMYLNALTGEGYDAPVEFIVSALKKGRFGTDDEDNIIASGFGHISPEGIPWVDHPLAEEQWKAAVNRGEKEWGEGPPISTTYNFFGYVAGSNVPVRLSLMRSASKPAKKWMTMLQFLPAFWDCKFVLGSTVVESGRNKFYLPTIEQGPKTSADERQAAVTFAQAIMSDAYTAPEDAAPTEARPAPEDDAGLGV
jgi:hypothetical protein